jgi:acetyltransferase-like isoleucine patch superfamily enzyme
MTGKLTIAVYRLFLRIRNGLFSRLAAGAFRGFGKGSTIQLPVVIWGESGIRVGSGSQIGPRSWLICLAGGESAETEIITIGDGCQFAGDLTITAARRVIIGAEVVIGRFVHISDHAHETSDPKIPYVRQGITRPAPVVIGDGCWLGQGVVVCPGVTIGRRCVIGANSVVKSDIPDGCLAVGAPARVVRSLHH